MANRPSSRKACTTVCVRGVAAKQRGLHRAQGPGRGAARGELPKGILA